MSVEVEVGGVYEPAADLTPSGVIVAFGGTEAPEGWLLCNGDAVSRTNFSKLFAAIGVKWGDGDTSTTFNLPDLIGASLSGAGTSTGYTRNETITFAEKHDDQFETHNHKLNSGQGNHRHTQASNGIYVTSSSPTNFIQSGANCRYTDTRYTAYATLPDMYTNSVSAGNDQATTRGKVVGVTYIIKT